MKWSQHEIEQEVLDRIGCMISRKLKEDALPRKLEELGIDSLNTIFLLCEFEKSQLFRIDLEQLSTMRLETVQSLVDLIYTYQEKL